MYSRLITGIALVILATGQAAAYDISQHQWRHRLLFLVAPSGDDPDLAAQLRGIELRRDAVLDRDIRVFQLFRDHGFAEERALTTDSARQLRQHLDVTAEDRLVILIGKDGEIKRRTNLNTDLRDVFLQIDAMPMRGSEIRAKKEAGIDVTSP